MEKIKTSLEKLSLYCSKEGYKGYDPYDGLNSKIFKLIPFAAKSRIVRLSWIQLMKHSPLNLRSLFFIRKDYNPKALALFLSGCCSNYKNTKDQEAYNLIGFFTDRLRESTSIGWSGPCWGYNFDWQAQAFFQPKGTPTVVVTSFVSNSLLDAYEITGQRDLLEIARRSCDFVLADLKRTHDHNRNFAFSYSPLDQSVVYNASLLGSRLLARVYSITGERELIEAAQKSVAFCCDKQHSDGSWSYGLADFHQWIDSFHTGYNIECISEYMKYSNDESYSNNLKRGFEYYIRTFFTPEGVSGYYNNSIFPIDIHAPAQLIITLSKLGRLNENRILAEKVLNWTIDKMQSPEGYFYYRKNRFYTNKISYMRWSQAWMFYAMSEYLFQIR